MSDFSIWRNPASSNSDREKPEVVAAGKNLDIWGWNDSLEADNQGTSLASPQVAGLDALLVKKNPSLAIWPEAARAIIMASAIHNIEGSPGISRTVDAKDGAGAIVADQAVAVASVKALSSMTCPGSCWWGESVASIPRGGNSLKRYFLAHAGQHVRVAIAWWGTADSWPYANDGLDTDLSLWIINPSGYPIAASVSRDNNYELVDLIAPETGAYQISVFNTVNSSPTAVPNYVGIAVVTSRYSIYLPAILR